MNKYNNYYEKLQIKVNDYNSRIYLNKKILSRLQDKYNLEKKDVSSIWSNIYETYKLTREDCESLKNGTYNYSNFGVIKKADVEFFYKHRETLDKTKSIYKTLVSENRQLKQERKFILDLMALVEVYKD